MRVSRFPLYTVKETPADAEVISHQLMLRAGLIRKIAAGVYTWMPLGLRVLRKVEAVVREEMNGIGCLEILMPAVQPAELWQESGRWQQYGPELLRLKDRHERDFCFGPTHEEIITDLFRREIRSYRQLPIAFYQVQTKFRDEVRPRFGVMRAREFIMKDAYSFDADEAGMARSYQIMFDAYTRIFTRMGLAFRAVDADTGAIGGNASHEFQVLASSGEDALAYSTGSDYAANVEKAEALMRYVGRLLIHRLALLIIDEAHQVVVAGTPKAMRDLAAHGDRSMRLESLVSRILLLKPGIARIALAFVGEFVGRVVEAHAPLAVLTEGDARAEPHAAEIEKDLGGIVAQAKIAAIDPGEIGGFGRRIAGSRQVGLQQIGQEPAIFVDAADDAVQPWPRVVISRAVGDDADVARMRAHAVSNRFQILGGIGAAGDDSRLESRQIPTFRGRRHTHVWLRAGNREIGRERRGWHDERCVNFVGDHANAIFARQLRQCFEFFARIDGTSRIVWIRKQHDGIAAARGGGGEGGLQAIEVKAAIVGELRCDPRPLQHLGHHRERRIDWRGENDGIAGIAQPLHGFEHSGHDIGYRDCLVGIECPVPAVGGE